MPQEHSSIPAHQNDENIALIIEGMVAKVYVREYSFPGGERQEVVFESGIGKRLRRSMLKLSCFVTSQALKMLRQFANI